MKVGSFKKIIFGGAIVFLLAPFFVFAQETSITLKEKQSLNLLDIIRRDPLSIAQSDLYNEAIYYPDSDKSIKTGAVMLVKQTILQNELEYWFVTMSVEFSKNFIKTVYKLLPLVAYGDFSGAIDLIEKYTVTQANQYIDNWLQQNQTQIGSGIGKYAFSSYKDNPQVINIPYIIVYSPVGADKAKIVVEFYSQKAIEPPQDRGGVGSLGGNQEYAQSTVWPWDRWITSKYNKNNQIEPFIVRVKGQVVKDKYGNFSWDKTAEAPSVVVEFNKPVPQIDKSDIILANYQKEQGQTWLQKNIFNPLQKILDSVKNTSSDLLAGLITRISQIWSPYSVASLSNQVIPLENFLPQIEAGLNDLKEIKQSDDLSEMADQLLSETQKVVDDSQKTATIATSTDPIKILSLATTTPNQNPTSSVAISSQATSTKATSTVWCTLDNYSIPPASQPLVFNEIAWMGSTHSASDEWLELRNSTNFPLDLSGWQIINQNQGIKIVLPANSFLNGNSFYLLERTDDNSAPTVKADLIYTGALSNTSETLYLFNPQCQLQDKVIATYGWPKGDSASRRTMERLLVVPPNQSPWQTSAIIDGTPKSPNSIGWFVNASGGGNQALALASQSAPTSTSTSTPTTTPEVTPTTTPTTSTNDIITDHLVISEIQLADNEFIELFNPTNQALDLSQNYWAYYSFQRDWNKPYRLKQFPASSTIASLSYYLIGLQGYPTSTTTTSSDWQPYNTDQLSNSHGSVGIFACSPNIATSVTITLEQAIEQAKACSIDTVGWGEVLVQETSSTVPAPTNQSLQRKQLSTNQFIDNQNNLIDFIIASSTPTNSQASPATSTESTSTPPAGLTSLIAYPSPTRNKVELLWSSNTAGQYLIRFSQKPIVENSTNTDNVSWQDATELNTGNLATTSPTGVLAFQTPDTLDPQTLYYFAIKYQVADGTVSALSNLAQAKPRAGFSNNTDGTVTDLLTGLMWPENGVGVLSQNGTSTDQDSAKQFLIDLNAGGGFAGFSDWRLPSYPELIQLVDFAKSNPTIQNAFSDIQSNCYWASNVSVRTRGAFPIEVSYTRWVVDFQNSVVRAEINSAENCYILPTRETAQKCNLAVQNNADGSVFDPCLKLTWQASNIPIGYYDPVSHITTGIPWASAFEYAITQPSEDNFKWRLPTIAELLNSPTNLGNLYWATTFNYLDPASLWAVDLKNTIGVTRTIPFNYDYYARLVKDN